MESKDINEKQRLYWFLHGNLPKETLRVDSTKDMPINEMFILYHQTKMGMASSLERATGHNRPAGALEIIVRFCRRNKIIDKNRLSEFLI